MLGSSSGVSNMDWVTTIIGNFLEVLDLENHSVFILSVFLLDICILLIWRWLSLFLLFVDGVWEWLVFVIIYQSVSSLLFMSLCLGFVLFCLPL